jgi:hypothetical protein
MDPCFHCGDLITRCVLAVPFFAIVKPSGAEEDDFDAARTAWGKED